MTKENDGSQPTTEDDGALGQSRKSDIQSKLFDRVPDHLSQKQTKGNVHFKILVPSIAAGAIIGKGGEAITDIQNKTSAKVKMSKANDFYPGTTERVCLIIGTIESILRVFQYISEKIYEKPESLLRIAAKGGRMPTERHKQVKILVPNSTAGIIIGKGGSFIKEVKDNTGVFIQVSQKSKELNLAERCVTIAGELSQTYDAVAQLLVKIADDPQSSSCPNISYAEVPRPVASAYPTGSPYALVMGSGFGLNNCPVPLASSDPLLGGCNPTAGPGSNVFPPTQLNSLSPISPSGSTATPGPVFGTNPPAFAAAVAAMGSAASFSPSGTGGNRTNGPTSQTAGRALTGRSLTAGHHSNQSASHASQSLLGSVNSQLGQSTPPAYGSPTNTNSGPSSGSATIGLEVVRNILRTAGYSDIATEEIANAMHVLNLYGFISMSSLTGCANAANSANNSLSNGHYAMAGSPLGNLSGSLSGYVSAGPQSPGFSGEVNSHFRSGIRNFGVNCAAPGQQTQQQQHYHHSTSHYYQQQQHPCTNTTTRRSSLHMQQQQPVHATPNVCIVPTCSPSTNSTSLSKNLNSNDSVGSVMANVTVTCSGSDPTSHLSAGPSDLFVNSGDIAVAAAAAVGATPGLHSSTQSPIKTVSPLSPCLTNSLPLTGNGLDLMQRLTESSSNGQLRPEEGSTNGNNCSSVGSSTKVMNGSRPSALWGVSCSPQSSSS